MKCSGCKYWRKNTQLGSGCACIGDKPCEVRHREKANDKQSKKRRTRY